MFWPKHSEIELRWFPSVISFGDRAGVVKFNADVLYILIKLVHPRNHIITEGATHISCYSSLNNRGLCFGGCVHGGINIQKSLEPCLVYRSESMIDLIANLSSFRSVLVVEFSNITFAQKLPLINGIVRVRILLDNGQPILADTLVITPNSFFKDVPRSSSFAPPADLMSRIDRSLMQKMKHIRPEVVWV